MLADIFERIKDHRQAFIELKKVVALKAATGPVFLRLGKIQLLLQNRENALSFFLEARSVDPLCFEACYQAAILQEDMNYLEPALASYEALLGTRKYREIAQMAIVRIRTLLDEVRAAMGPVEEAPSNITPFRGTGPLTRTAAMPA
jgi:tetratricopeptide (TPR) repeat protein